MQKKNAKEFWEKIEKDPSFRTELLKAKNDQERQAILKRYHFQFTRQEYENAFEVRRSRAMNREELKNISAAGLSSEGLQFHESVGSLLVH